MQLFDWIVVGFVTVVSPFLGLLKHRRLVRRVAQGIPHARAQHYGQVMLVEWTFAIAVFLLWRAHGRGLSELGLGTPITVWTWVGWAVAAAVVVLLVVQSIQVLRDAEKLSAVRQQVEPLRALIPVTRGDARLFNFVSLTAGICEEFVYRGYLIAVLTGALNIWLGVAISSLVFGLGHAYQGPKGIVKTGIVGLVMAGLYQLTGSLWAPMLVHAAVDVNSGILGRRALASREPTPDIKAAA